MSNKRLQQAKILRNFRKVHKYTGITLVIFFLLVAFTGLTLGWKKHSSGKILPKTLQGTSTKLEDWLSIYQLENIANNRLEAYIDKSEIIELDRIDIRKNKGIVKYIFKNNNYEIQLDGVTGDVLQVGVRHSDWI